MDLHEFGFTRGRMKTGGEEGMQSKGYICHALLCSTALLTFVSKYSDFFFTYDTTCNGGGQLLPEGWHFICHGGGGGELPPPPRLCLIRGCMVST